MESHLMAFVRSGFEKMIFLYDVCNIFNACESYWYIFVYRVTVC